jgi:hypothetical protein
MSEAEQGDLKYLRRLVMISRISISKTDQGD